MKFKRITWFVIFIFCCTIIGPLLMPAPQVEAATIDLIVNDISLVYPYIDDVEKSAIQEARTALATMASESNRDNETYGPQWDAVLGIGTSNNLLTSQVIGKFKTGEMTDEQATAAARNALIDFAAGVGNIYYTSDQTTLTNTLNNFKTTFQPHFQTLFGKDIALDALYRLLSDTKANLPAVIGGSDINGSYIDTLAFKSNDKLVETMPNVINDAMAKALLTNTDFSGRLSAIGWSTQKLINQQKVLGGCVDTGNKGQLALAKAAVRSETKLAEVTPTTFTVGQEIPHDILIMGKNATNLVEWRSSDDSVVKVTTDEGTGNYILTAIGPGEATLTAYRDVETVGPTDWIFEYVVTVEGSAVKYGDVNGDGQVDLNDAIQIAYYDAFMFSRMNVTAKENLEGAQCFEYGDIDQNGTVDLNDAIQIAYYDAFMYNRMNDKAKARLGIQN